MTSVQIYNRFYDELWLKINEKDFQLTIKTVNYWRNFIGLNNIVFDKQHYNERLQYYNNNYLIESWIIAQQDAFSSDNSIIDECVNYYYIQLTQELIENLDCDLCNKL